MSELPIHVWFRRGRRGKWFLWGRFRDIAVAQEALRLYRTLDMVEIFTREGPEHPAQRKE